MVLFQILIPTLPGREHMLAELMAALEAQLTPSVSLHLDAGPGSIGAKRQRMIEDSVGEYIAFVDDDDMVAPDYVERVLPCLAHRPDCVGITMHVTIDGRDWHPSPIFRHSLRFKENYLWHGQDRTPHHLCPLRREIALRARFPDLMWGEDYNYAQGILQHLHTEEWSGDAPLYFYRYVSKKGDPPVPGKV
jgi:glycosyltransferase involved in cell wall biosynthesis